jgi:very-short-patch-repair endonuclease
MGRAGVGLEPESSMRPIRSTSKTLHRAGELRKETTPAEKKLWAYLRGNKLMEVNFRRHTCHLPRELSGVRGRCQGHAIGRYIVDFCSPKAKLVIELDGSQHLDQEDYDEERTAYLASRGYKVIRFWNNAVMNNIESVILAINYALEEKS